MSELRGLNPTAKFGNATFNIILFVDRPYGNHEGANKKIIKIVKAFVKKSQPETFCCGKIPLTNSSIINYIFSKNVSVLKNKLIRPPCIPNHISSQPTGKKCIWK